jgi:hypothetical protein
MNFALAAAAKNTKIATACKVILIMKSKKSLLLGLALFAVAATGFAAYQFSSACCDESSCCVPGCCGEAASAECCVKQ